MKRADASGAAFAVIVGEAEAAAGQVAVKPLRQAGRAGERQRDAGGADGARCAGRRVPATQQLEQRKTRRMYDLEEQEQIDALKAWWRQHGRLVIVAAVAAIVGCRRRSAAGATTRTPRRPRPLQLYATLEKAVRANDVKQVKELAGQLMDKYGGTAYGPMAALAAAKAELRRGRPGERGASGWSGRSSTRATRRSRAVARLRLAGVRLDEKKYDEALKLLEGKHPESFAGMYADLRGDTLRGAGQDGGGQSRLQACAGEAARAEHLPAPGAGQAGRARGRAMRPCECRP